jgi:hypothetical protein
MKMKMVQENSCTRRTMPARAGIMNPRKSGTISFHVIVSRLNVSALPFPEQQRAQTALAKSTGFTIIITVRAMSAHEPELKEKNKLYRQ